MRFELSLFRALMECLESRWLRYLNSMVMSSNPSMTGRGLTGVFWPREVVPSVGHTSERSSFRRCEGPITRNHAFQAAFFEPVDPCTECLRSLQEDAPDELWLEDPNFLEVPAQYSRPTEPGYGRTRRTSFCWRLERSTKPAREFIILMKPP